MISTRYKLKLACQVAAPLATVIARSSSDDATANWANNVARTANSVLFALDLPKPPITQLCITRIKSALSSYPMSYQKQAKQLGELFTSLVEA